MKGCRPLSDQEVQVVLMSFAGKYELRDKLLFLLGVKSGFRISEILSLRIGDVYKSGSVLDYVTVHRRHMKKKIEGRSVLMHPEVKEAVCMWFDNLSNFVHIDKDTFLFRSRQGSNKAMSRVRAWQILNEAYEANEFSGQLGTHSLRKTFANGVYTRLNKDLISTARALGHKNVNSTMSYLSFRQDDIDAAIISL